MTMYIYIYIIAALATMAFIIFVIRKVFRSRKASKRIKQEREAERQATQKRLCGIADGWIKRIEAADSDAEVVKVGAFPEVLYYFKLEGRLKDALDRYRDTYVREQRKVAIRKYIKRYETLTAPIEKAELCLELHREHYLDDVLGLSNETVGDRIVQLMLEELSMAREGDGGSLLRFLNFRETHRIDSPCSTLLYMLSDEQKAALRVPDDWDELVTEHIETPSLYDFQFILREPEPGTVRLLAAQALDERSLKLGKIVLAFCSVRQDVMGNAGHRGGQSRQAVWPYRQEIGDVLLAEVTKMVYTIHSERSMSYEL